METRNCTMRQNKEATSLLQQFFRQGSFSRGGTRRTRRGLDALKKTRKKVLWCTLLPCHHVLRITQNERTFSRGVRIFFELFLPSVPLSAKNPPNSGKRTVSEKKKREKRVENGVCVRVLKPMQISLWTFEEPKGCKTPDRIVYTN